MASVSWLKYAYLAHFSKPRSERQLYRLAKVHGFCRIVEVGVRSLERTISLIQVAQRFAENGKVAYTGIDWFDARPAEMSKLTLKDVHRGLQGTGAQVRLVPGEPGRSISTIANAHAHTGLILISSDVTDSALSSSWFYVPRMLDPLSIVVRERRDASGESTFEMVPIQQIVELAVRPAGRRAA